MLYRGAMPSTHTKRHTQRYWYTYLIINILYVFNISWSTSPSYKTTDRQIIYYSVKYEMRHETGNGTTVLCKNKNYLMVFFRICINICCSFLLLLCIVFCVCVLFFVIITRNTKVTVYNICVMKCGLVHVQSCRTMNDINKKYCEKSLSIFHCYYCTISFLTSPLFIAL